MKRMGVDEREAFAARIKTKAKNPLACAVCGEEKRAQMRNHKSNVNVGCQLINFWLLDFLLVFVAL